jgi:hypothetical protein
MGSYFQQDIKTFDDGEIDISSGDIPVATVQQSQRQLLINILNTTRGGFRFNDFIGWGAERYMGKKNVPIVHEIMKEDLRTGLQAADDLILEDIDYTVSFLSEEVAAIIVRHSGLFYEEDGTLNNTPLVLGWRLSFLTGQIEPETE